MKKINKLSNLVPVMLAFFAMGIVDLVGIASNYIKIDFELSDTLASLFPSMVFLWFLLFSIPTGMLMNRIGQRKMVIVSLVITFMALFIPFMVYSFIGMLISFTFLGIGNILMQVSLNPLLANIVRKDELASKLTLGQLVKAVASFLSPIIAAWAASFWGDWKILYAVFTVVTFIATISLYFTDIDERPIVGKTSTFRECFQLFGDKLVLLLFIGILVHVGIDVGVNITGPRLLMEQTGIQLTDAGYITSFYFLCRTIGCFLGVFVLKRYLSTVFYISALSIAIAVIGMYFSTNTITIYICVGLIGIGNSNVFPILFSRALQHLPNRQQDIFGHYLLLRQGTKVSNLTYQYFLFQDSCYLQ